MTAAVTVGLHTCDDAAVRVRATGSEGEDNDRSHGDRERLPSRPLTSLRRTTGPRGCRGRDCPAGFELLGMSGTVWPIRPLNLASIPWATDERKTAGSAEVGDEVGQVSDRNSAKEAGDGEPEPTRDRARRGAHAL